MSKPVILVTNDDGINALGLRSLIKVMKTIGKVAVVAPDKVRSGTGHAITIDNPLRLEVIAKQNDYQEYSCNGTPVDCVKLGELVVLHHKPDLIVSGINHGSNSAINIIYSGTMAAVIEGAIEKIPSIGFSLLDYSMQADFKPTEKYVKAITEEVLKNGLPTDTCLNVNFPAVKESEIKGIKVCRQAEAYWDEKFEKRKDPHNKEYYWLSGAFKNYGDGKDTDEWALANNYVSIVPVQFDLTAHNALPKINNWKFKI